MTGRSFAMPIQSKERAPHQEVLLMPEIRPWLLTCLLVILVFENSPVLSQSSAKEPPPSRQQMVTMDRDSTPPPASSAPVSSADKPGAKKPMFSLNAESEALKLTDDIQIAKEQLRKHPNSTEAHFLMAAAYSRSPYLNKAFSHIKKAKNLLKAEKDFEFIDRAIQDYESLLQNSPNDPIILYRLAFIYYFKGYSLEKYPHHYKNGPSGNKEEFYQRARETMARVIEINPQDTWARNYLGYLTSDNGRNLAKAIPIWQESLAIDSEQNAGAYLLLSQAYFKQGNLKEALVYGAKGLEIQQKMGMLLP